MAVSTHKVEIVPVVLEKHPDADSLSLVHIYNWQVVTKTADWETIPKVGAYIQPDSIVDVTRPEFSWLKRHPDDVKPHKVRVIRLRKALSQGLLIPAPEGFNIGDDAAEYLGVRHYEPPTQEELDSQGGDSASAEAYTGPQVHVPTYDIESMYRYAAAFKSGEQVYVTEKLHGQNTKYMFDGERMWAGTRKEWKKPGAGSTWEVLNYNQWILDFCRAYPMRVLYGELFGWVQTLHYGAMPGEFWFRAFDVFDQASYWSPTLFRHVFTPEQRVPDLGDVPFDFEMLQGLAEGDTTLPVPPSHANFAIHLPPLANTNKRGKDGKTPIPNMREGIVVKPMEERYEHSLGRVVLKLVSNTYLETVKE